MAKIMLLWREKKRISAGNLCLFRDVAKGMKDDCGRFKSLKM
jgi:hypothetical protein